MTTLIAVEHDLRTGAVTLTHADESGVRCSCCSYKPSQIGDFKLAAGEHAQKYIDLAGWTPEYIAAVAAEEKRLADAAQAKADAEEAERKAAKEKAEQEAFDAEVKRQVEIMKKAKEIVDKSAT